MIQIRDANMFDHTQILKLLTKWFDESKFIKGYNSAASSWLSGMICNEDSKVFIAEDEGKIVGTIGLRKTTMPWNSEKPFLYGEFIMTDINYRHHGVAGKLLERIKQIAKITKIPLLIGHFTGTDPELKDRYFQINGFNNLGGNFSYNGE